MCTQKVPSGLQADAAKAKQALSTEEASINKLAQEVCERASIHVQVSFHSSQYYCSEVGSIVCRWSFQYCLAHSSQLNTSDLAQDCHLRWPSSKDLSLQLLSLQLLSEGCQDRIDRTELKEDIWAIFY